MIIELWKDIKDYEGIYKISNIGRVRGIERYVNHPNSKSGKQLIKPKIIKSRINKHGYVIINLSKQNKKVTYQVHRLVANIFIKNPDEKVTVNHIDGDKSNNKIDNLEWMSYSENMQHSWDTNLRDKTTKS